MPAPYSDNLYSGDDDNEEQQDAFSPTDGYFHASSSPSDASAPHDGVDSPRSPQHQRASDQVPRVPNVLVEDPTLREQQAGAKAREAEEERRLNNPQHSSSSTLPSAAAAQSPQPHSDSHPSPPSSATPSSSRHLHRRTVDDDAVPSSQDETTPLFQQRHQHHHQHPQTDAPPAYSPPDQSTQHAQATYQTFAPTPLEATTTAMGLPEEEQRLLPRQPESMGGSPSDEPKDNYWARTKKAFKITNLRKMLRNLFAILLIISIFAMIFSSFTLQPSHKHPELGKEPIKEPVKEPVQQPGKNPKMGDGDMVWSPPPTCLGSSHKFPKSQFKVDVHYDRKLTIIQAIDKDKDKRSGWSPHVSGEVRLRPSPEDAPGRIEVEVMSNDEDLVVKQYMNSDAQEFRILTPQRVDWPSSTNGPCIQIRITAWIPRESVIKAMSLSTVHLDINLDSGLIFGAEKDVQMSTVSGDISTPQLDNEAGAETDGDEKLPFAIKSREIRMETISGDIKGSFPMYDLLYAKTTSGDIRMYVCPKKVDEDHPKSAVLDVKTISGTIKIFEPVDKGIEAAKPDRAFPSRDYIFLAHSTSGDITAQAAFSSEANVSSSSGDLKLRLWPILDSRGAMAAAGVVKLMTDTKSGDTKVNLLEPLWISLDPVGVGSPGGSAGRPHHGNDNVEWGPADDKDPYIIIHPNTESPPSQLARRELTTSGTPALSHLTSSHKSISGGVTLVYPGSWEGYLYAHTISGQQSVRGEGLRITHSSSRFMKTLQGHKGSGSSSLSIASVSGDHDILIGRDDAESA